MIIILELIIGRAGSGKTQTCLNSMREILNEYGLKAKIFLLMPDYMTYKTEHQFAEMIDGAVNTYSYSFQRFARQILIEVGGANIPKINEIGRRIILRQILMRRDKAQELRYFSRAVKQRGFSETLAETIKELRAYDIKPETLQQATENIADEELFDKILDLAMLEEDFLKALEGNHYDDEDVIELAIEKISHSQLCKDAEIFIDGYVFFDPMQRKLISEILTHARNLHVTLPMSPNLNDRENDTDVGLFRQSMKTFKTLMNIADKVHVETKITRLNLPDLAKGETPKRFKRHALAFLEQNLFAYPPSKVKIENQTDSLKIIEAATRRVEVEAVTQDLLKLKQDKGYRFRDIGILFRNENYVNLLKPVFEQHEIPFFSDMARPAIHHPLSELILSSLDLLTSWRPDAIFYCLRTGFFEVEQSDVDLLENYVIEFGIKGLKSWTQSESWSWFRREYDNGSDKPSDKERERLQKVNAIRQQVIEPLVKFSAAIDEIIVEKSKKSAKVRDIAEALFALLENLQVPQTLKRWSKEAADKKDLALSREHLTIWNEVVNLFEQIVAIMGDEVIPIKEFTALMLEGIEALKMSLIPQALDDVTVASLNQNSLQNSKAIYILGCNDGVMPASGSEKGLFSDLDRLSLNEQANIEIHAGQIENALAEKFLLYRGFTEAQEYLCISYTLSDSKSEAMKKSPLISKIRKIIPNVTVETPTIEILGSNSDVLFLVDDKKISPDIAAKLFARYKNTVKSSVSKIEGFMSCPFKHFAQHGLKLEERRERKFRTLDLGNLLHSLLKNFGLRMQAQARLWSTVDNEELVKIVDEIFDEIVPPFNNKILLSNETYKYQLERIKRVGIRSLRRLIELDKVSKFHPEQFELSFGLPDGSEPLSFKLNDKMKLDISGRIDRIDFSEDGKYFLIMDYKTGNAYLNLLDVYCGLNLQLLTYLLAADEQLVERIPAAMFYFFIKYRSKSYSGQMSDNEAREYIEKSLKMPGWVLADSKVVHEIDDSLKFIKVNINDDGSFSKLSLPNVKTADEFKHLLKYVGETLKAAGNRIISGEITVKPYKDDKNKRSACDFCEYSAVCGFDPSMQNYDWFHLPNLTDKQIMKDICKDN